MKKIAFILAAATFMVGCNDAKYSTLGMRAYINESAQNKNVRVVITETGAKAELTVCLSEAATEDSKFRFEIDPSLLDIYNAKMASSFLALPSELVEFPDEIVVKKGQYSADISQISLLPLKPEHVGETYALPIRLVSTDGAVEMSPATSTFVIPTEAVTVTDLPMFTGGPGLFADDAELPLNLPNFTVECRFQVSNTGNRNRFVFTNGGSVLMRFEDPQSNTADDLRHSMIQFQGEGWYINPQAGQGYKANVWNHMALVYDGLAATIYVNGAFAGRKEGTAAPEFATLYWFGGNVPGHGNSTTFWSGCKILCTEMRVWSTARTDAQIANNMITTSTKSAGLVGYWRMDAYTEADGYYIFPDLTGNGHDIKTQSSFTMVEGIKSTDTATVWP